MKRHHIIPLIIAVVILSTTVSSCVLNEWLDNAFDKFSEKFYHFPVSAEINGVKYHSEGHYRFVDAWSIFGEGKFQLNRELFSDDNEYFDVSVEVQSDIMKTDTLYDAKCSIERRKNGAFVIYGEGIGHVQFTLVRLDPDDKDEFHGIFEFSVTDKYSGTVYNATDGKFEVRCKPAYYEIW